MKKFDFRNIQINFNQLKEKYKLICDFHIILNKKKFSKSFTSFTV